MNKYNHLHKKNAHTESKISRRILFEEKKKQVDEEQKKHLLSNETRKTVSDINEKLNHNKKKIRSEQTNEMS